MKCTLCPHNCNIDRSEIHGACNSGDKATLCRVAPHYWEEPCISDGNGSGAIFFGGCNLRCRFCQNYDISRTGKGVEVTTERLADVLRYVNDSGVNNINLVTPSQFSDVIASALELAKPHLTVPVIYNTNSYEKVSAIRRLDGLVDVYLPDLKFCDGEVSRNLCGAKDYFDVATQALTEMFRQQPVNLYDGKLIKKGVIIRHLVLPSFVEDSKRVLDYIASNYPTATVSLMAQYFPPRTDDKYPQLNRKLYRHEYDNITQYFFNVGLTNGYMQQAESATEDYVPEFDVVAVQQLLQQVTHYYTEKDEKTTEIS